MERMRDELGRARRRGRRVVMLDQVQSPMDLNPTVDISAAIIADCVRQVDGARTAENPLVDEGMRQAANGNAGRRNTA
jgi:hypothetical protein